MIIIPLVMVPLIALVLIWVIAALSHFVSEDASVVMSILAVLFTWLTIVIYVIIFLAYLFSHVKIV
jgi:hypothetical protein